MTNEDAPDIAKVDGQPSSKTIEQRSPRASGEMVDDDRTGPPQGPDGSGALLGLEPPTTENKQENDGQAEDSNPQQPRNPLLGTSLLKSLDELSQTRSSERVCYDSLLRFGAHNSDLSIEKTVRNGPRGCYGFSHGFLPRGMILRGDRYYLRRHIPSDIQPIIGRLEVWRSLKTDSLQTALRRLSLATSVIETAFERRGCLSDH